MGRISAKGFCWILIGFFPFISTGCSKPTPVVKEVNEPELAGWYEAIGPWGDLKCIRLGKDKSVMWVSQGASGAPRDVIVGTYTIEHGVIQLDSDINVNARAEQWHLVPIRWDHRIYLIPPWYILAFYFSQENEKANSPTHHFYMGEGQEHVVPKGPAPVTMTEIEGEIVDVSQSPIIRGKLTKGGPLKAGLWVLLRGPSLNEGWGAVVQVISCNGDELSLRANHYRYGAGENIEVGNNIGCVFEIRESKIKL